MRGERRVGGKRGIALARGVPLQPLTQREIVAPAGGFGDVGLPALGVRGECRWHGFGSEMPARQHFGAAHRSRQASVLREDVRDRRLAQPGRQRAELLLVCRDRRRTRELAGVRAGDQVGMLPDQRLDEPVGVARRQQVAQRAQQVRFDHDGRREQRQ
ncbi:MAG: hypothetical protein CAPSK01_002282 [Candidatus Accumulibacter vicinus]|uniref:Uncharacterized protein n=1 Tax=Candidatus Accumulibacter vicinus TaxID=2954382 RepID=A0A084Y134_9PROT|nr:MAG: hypothetical protein CAPSK01_002282 [Candidatus Accumulibacter vicinus]